MSKFKVRRPRAFFPETRVINVTDRAGEPVVAVVPPVVRPKKRQTRQTFDVATVRVHRMVWLVTDLKGEKWIAFTREEADDWVDDGAEVIPLYKVLEDA